jgi:hypothetical protein
MKSLRLLFVLLTPMLFFACSKEKSFEVSNENNTPAQWEFFEGSKPFKGPVDTAVIADLGGGIKTLVVEGTSDDGTGFLTLGIIGFNPLAPATYKSPNVLFDYSKSTGVVYENDLTAVGKFTIEITKIDSASVTGVFFGEVKDSTGATKTISNGKFSARLAKTSVQPGTAQITFWGKNSCTAGGNISVKLSNNQTGTISSFTATAPACGATGAANFTVSPGTYAWTAKCGGDSTTGVITIAASQCVRQEVVFGGTPPPTGQASFWAKASCTAGGNITVRLNNNQTGTISTFTATAPANCTTNGNANFNLPVGNYTWVAKCGPSDSVSGNLSIVASQCAKVEVIFPQGPGAQYSLISAGGNCSNINVNGTYIVGKPLSNDTNTVTVQVNVTAIGSYNISTNTVNGYSFSAVGNFTTTGVQTVTLKGSGTPGGTGTNSFTVTAGTSTCNFSVNVINPPPSNTLNTWSFTQGARTFSGEFTFPGFFGDDVFGFGKALDMFGEIPGTDTVLTLYIQFPAAATQPSPGTFITDPNLFSSNTTNFNLWNAVTFGDIYYCKSQTGAGSPVKMTIIITSYDAVNKIVKGTFSGQAWNSSGQIVNITNGKFECEVEF